MSSLFVMQRVLCRQFTRVDTGEVIKRSSIQGTGAYSVQKGVDDPIDVYVLELRNMVVGSRVRIEAESTGALIDTFVASTSTESRNLYYFGVSDYRSSLRIKVGQGTSAPFYKRFTTLASAALGTVVVYISQELDQ